MQAMTAGWMSGLAWLGYVGVLAIALMGGGVAAAEEPTPAQGYRPSATRATPQAPGPANVASRAYVGAGQQAPMQSPVGGPRNFQPAEPVRGQPVGVPLPTNLVGEVGGGGPYTLGADDVVYIDVRGQPEFTGTYVIGRNGRIQYGIVGDVPADGLTKEELAEALAAHLQKYVRFPDVTVTIVGFNSKAIYIVGEVQQPGKYAMRGDTIPLRDALVAALMEGEFAALGRVKVIKPSADTPEVQVVNLKKAMYQGQLAHDIELVDGDVVVIPKTVWGHVASFMRAVFGPIARVASYAW